MTNLRVQVKPHLISTLFVLVGLLIGGILALQIRANPVAIGTFPLEQLENEKALLNNFSVEQDELKKQLEELQQKRTKVQAVIEKRSSRQIQTKLESLKALTGLNEIKGEGLRLTLADNPHVSRLDFSGVDENFVQSAHLRDLINALYLKGASAISINKKRILPLTPIQSAFDSILVDNVQLVSPFVVEAVGNPDALKAATGVLAKTHLRIFIDELEEVTLGSSENSRTFKYLFAAQP